MTALKRLLPSLSSTTSSTSSTSQTSYSSLTALHLILDKVQGCPGVPDPDARPHHNQRQTLARLAQTVTEAGQERGITTSPAQELAQGVLFPFPHSQYLFQSPLSGVETGNEAIPISLVSHCTESSKYEL